MEEDANISTISTFEAQLQRLIKAITESSDVAANEMRRYFQEGFTEVCTKLDSIYNVVARRGHKSTVVQDFVSISTKSRYRNVQVPSTAIDVEREDANSSLQQLQSIALDINKLSTQTLVHM